MSTPARRIVDALCDLSPEERTAWFAAHDVDADERAQAFWVGFNKLSDKDREILALRHFKELAYKEIAVTLGIPEGTVMSRLFHARRRLREALGPLLGESTADPKKKEGAR